MTSQYTEKQIRNGAVGSDYVPVPSNDPAPPEFRQVEAAQHTAQQAYAKNPYYNTTNNKKRGSLMSEGDLIEQSQLPPREAPGGSARAASVSADNEFSVAETQRLQGTAQRLIEDNRVVVIGSEP